MALPCVADRCITPDKRRINMAPLRLAIQQLRDEQSPWSEVLALVFGYSYDKDWRLRKTKDNEGFTYIDTPHFDLLADVVIQYVQERLKTEYSLVEMWIPEKISGPKCNVFHSQDFFNNTGRCLLLIQGAGDVRAGVWSRSVCIKSTLTAGSMFPALDFASAHNFSTLIFNPNMTHAPDGTPIPHNYSMEAHSLFVWESYVRRCPAQEVYILAHSCGGVCTAVILQTFEDEFVRRVKAVAFTDSVHQYARCSAVGRNHLANVSVDFVASQLPLGTFVQSEKTSRK